jgi:hypothetical protein
VDATAVGGCDKRGGGDGGWESNAEENGMCCVFIVLWLPTHPYLIKYFILVQVRPIEQSIYLLHRATAAAGASTCCAWFGESPRRKMVCAVSSSYFGYRRTHT